MQKGTTETITATIKPTNATNKNVSWTSGNTLIATVAGSGLTSTITGIAGGTTNITVKTVDGNKQATCSVTVLETGVISQVGSTSWDSTAHTASITIQTTAEGYTFEYQKNSNTGTWTTISGSQTTITGLSNGDIIYARIRYGTEVAGQASFDIQDLETPVGATITLESNSAHTGESITAQVTHTDNQSGINVTACKYIYNTTSTDLGIDSSLWESSSSFTSNPQTINVSSSIAGSYYLHVLTVDSAGNKTETISSVVEVTNILVTGITLNQTSASLVAGNTLTLTATITPSNAENKNITWSSSNEEIATVTQAGVVTGIGAGTVTITATAQDGSNVKGTCTITVTVPSISSMVESGTIKIGDYVNYSPTGTTTTVLAQYSGYNSSDTSSSTGATNQNISRDTSLKWRVLDIKDGKVRLISNKATSNSVALQGALGFNNGVKILNDVCSNLYSDGNNCSYSVKSLAISDVCEKVLPEKNVDVFELKGTTVTPLSSYRYYPSIYPTSNVNKGTEYTSTFETANSPEEIQSTYTTSTYSSGMTSAYYSSTYTELSQDAFKDGIYYTLFINDGSGALGYYWLATRVVSDGLHNGIMGQTIVNFQMGLLSESEFLMGGGLFCSDLSYQGQGHSIRPVVTLKDTVKVSGGNGETGWNITN